MATYYDELLSLCSFDVNEIEKGRARFDAAFKKLGLVQTDMDRAVTRVNQYFDVELLGVRKALGVWLKELFDIVLARDEGKKLIYFGYPPFQYTGMAIKAATLKSTDDFYIGCPEVVLCQTLGQIFDTLTPVIEEGEAKGLPPGHAMCSLLQIKNGALEKGIIPVPDMSIATSYYCDMGPKADELMQHRYGYPVVYMDGCLDAPWGEWPDYDRELVHYLGGKVNELFVKLKDLFGLEIDEAVWEEAKKLAGKCYAAFNQLNQFLAADPVPLSQADIELVFNFPTACTGIGMEEGPEATKILAEEVEKRVEKGFGILPKGAPRVLLLLQSFSDPAFNQLIEKVGMAVPVTFTLLPPPRAPEPYPYPTLGEKRAEQAMYGGVYHSSYGTIKRIEESIKFAEGIDGIIYNYQFSCRPLVCNTKLLKHHLEKTTGLPTLLLETDYYDKRSYSEGPMRTRLETFSEMISAGKAAA